jgi:hypothetical protein
LKKVVKKTDGIGTAMSFAPPCTAHVSQLVGSMPNCLKFWDEHVIAISPNLLQGTNLTALIILYVLCGSVGYVSGAYLQKFTDQTKWKLTLPVYPDACVDALPCQHL